MRASCCLPALHVMLGLSMSHASAICSSMRVRPHQKAQDGRKLITCLQTSRWKSLHLRQCCQQHCMPDSSLLTPARQLLLSLIRTQIHDRFCGACCDRVRLTSRSVAWAAGMQILKPAWKLPGISLDCMACSTGQADFFSQGSAPTWGHPRLMHYACQTTALDPGQAPFTQQGLGVSIHMGPPETHALCLPDNCFRSWSGPFYTAGSWGQHPPEGT